MSIRSISSSAPGLGFGQAPSGGSNPRRPVVEDASALSSLTWGDREIIAAMFGPDLLVAGRDRDGEPVSVPPFVWQVIEDRRSGRLPAGSEITSGYLTAFWDRHRIDVTGLDAASRSTSIPLTPEGLAAALDCLGRRPQGAILDIRA